MTYDIADLYAPDGRYRYNRYGTNWRAVVAWLFGCIPMIPGFAAAVSILFKTEHRYLYSDMLVDGLVIWRIAGTAELL